MAAMTTNGRTDGLTDGWADGRTFSRSFAALHVQAPSSMGQRSASQSGGVPPVAIDHCNRWRPLRWPSQCPSQSGGVPPVFDLGSNSHWWFCFMALTAALWLLSPHQPQWRLLPPRPTMPQSRGGATPGAQSATSRASKARARSRHSAHSCVPSAAAGIRLQAL